MKRNLVFWVAYDGTGYSGWQKQKNSGVITVQGEIERVLSILCAEAVNIEGTSRTDAGVHARGQVFRLIGDFAIPTENILRAANNLLNKDISLLRVEERSLDFHPRFDCTKKTYLYRILPEGRWDPFRKNHTYILDNKLNVTLMKKAMKYFEGVHDFAAFQSAGGSKRATTVRKVFSVEIEEVSDEVHIRVTGDGFLYNMVRIMAGTLIDVGQGRIFPKDIGRIIEKKDRALAGHTAPPRGLILERIYFEEKNHG